MRSARSKTVTQWPALLSWAAAANPAGPEPTTATFLPVGSGGGSGRIQPILKALIDNGDSMVLIVTGGSLMPRTQEPSHGAGQTRPVNSGKLFGFVQPFERLAATSRDRPGRSTRESGC